MSLEKLGFYLRHLYYTNNTNVITAAKPETRLTFFLLFLFLQNRIRIRRNFFESILKGRFVCDQWRNERRITIFFCFVMNSMNRNSSFFRPHRNIFRPRLILTSEFNLIFAELVFAFLSLIRSIILWAKLGFQVRYIMLNNNLFNICSPDWIEDYQYLLLSSFFPESFQLLDQLDNLF